MPAGAVHSVQEALDSEMAQAYLTGSGDCRKVQDQRDPLGSSRDAQGVNLALTHIQMVAYATMG